MLVRPGQRSTPQRPGLAVKRVRPCCSPGQPVWATRSASRSKASAGLLLGAAPRTGPAIERKYCCDVAPKDDDVRLQGRFEIRAPCGEELVQLAVQPWAALCPPPSAAGNGPRGTSDTAQSPAPGNRETSRAPTRDLRDGGTAVRHASDRVRRMRPVRRCCRHRCGWWSPSCPADDLDLVRHAVSFRWGLWRALT